MIATNTDFSVDDRLNPDSPAYDYHGDSTRPSATMLKHFKKYGPRDFEATFINKIKPTIVPNRAMDRGSVVHEVALEGADINEFVLRYPDFCLNKKGGLVGAWSGKVRDIIYRLSMQDDFDIVESDPKYEGIPDSFWADLRSRETLPRYVMKDDEVDNALSIFEALQNHEMWKWLSSPLCIREEQIIWEDRVSGLTCRCKPDFVIPATNHVLLFDLKVTVNWSKDDFRGYLGGSRKGGQRGYIQACHYANALSTVYGKPVQVRFVCVNPEQPHQVRCHAISPETMDAIVPAYKETIKDLADRIRTGDWSDPDETGDCITTLDEWEIC